MCERWIPEDALTPVEASGNTRVIVNRLQAIGRKVEVLNSDILQSIGEKDRVNDRIDSEKLTYAYARGNANGKSVWMPCEEYAGCRDLISGYIRRFPSAKHLVSYFGLNPSVNASGEQEPRQPALFGTRWLGSRSQLEHIQKNLRGLFLKKPCKTVVF